MRLTETVRNWTYLAWCFVCVLCASCAKDPIPTPIDGGLGTDATGYCDPLPSYVEVVASCQPSVGDYQPRLNSSANDAWPACISDDNVYHPINASISTIARVAAFEQIAQKLWGDRRIPSAQDFIDARVIYAQDQGLDSRVQRREDIHYAALAEPCSTAGVPAQFPDRCVGPATLLPILNDAFAGGSLGEMPVVHAARIEAALLWFLYVSTLSEVTSCASKPQDCDSAWAYYSGGTPRESPLGLARYVDALGSETQDRCYDAVLAARCWRNLDNETGAAANLELRDRARAQLDRAMLRGIALIARQRITELSCSKGDVLSARWAFLKTLVPFLDRSARERDAALADVLMAQVTKDAPEQVEVEAAVSALDGLFGCP